MSSSRSSLHSSSSSQDDIELSALEEVAMTPRANGHGHANGNGHGAHANGVHKHLKYDDEDSDREDDEDEGDDGERALLGQDVRPRGRERLADGPVSPWAEAKSILTETAPTLLFTTLGLLFTGELLDHISRWKAMTRVNELIMIVPVVLNLKGNLEMNLSARLGTAAHMGGMDDPAERRALIFGNLALLQVQAAVVSFVAANVSFLLGFLVPPIHPPEADPGGASMLLARAPKRPPRPINDGRPASGLAEYIMVASCAMSAACLSSILLGSFMCALVVLCRRFGLDPDNIAPPIASCLGDLVTLTLLGAVASLLISFINTPLPGVFVLLVALSAIACFAVVRRNHSVRDLVGQGWSPLFGAMVISSGTGIVLDTFVDRYEGFALIAVVIGGLPGGAGSIFVSRLSTTLHAAAAKSSPSSDQGSSRVVMLTLLLVTVPISVAFLTALRVFGWFSPPLVFVAFVLIFFCLAVSASLLLARLLTRVLWARGLDPDTYALPIHSALVDLISQLLLVACFELVGLLGVDVRSRPEA